MTSALEAAAGLWRAVAVLGVVEMAGNISFGGGEGKGDTGRGGRSDIDGASGGDGGGMGGVKYMVMGNSCRASVEEGIAACVAPCMSSSAASPSGMLRRRHYCENVNHLTAATTAC